MASITINGGSNSLEILPLYTILLSTGELLEDEEEDAPLRCISSFVHTGWKQKIRISKNSKKIYSKYPNTLKFPL